MLDILRQLLVDTVKNARTLKENGGYDMAITHIDGMKLVAKTAFFTKKITANEYEIFCDEVNKAQRL